MSRGIDSNSSMFICCRQKKSMLTAKQIIKLWNASECTCVKGSTNLSCPLNKIIYTLRCQRSFRTFKKVIKCIGSIARSRPERQKRKNHLRYISKCNSGPFYRRMRKNELNKIKNNPTLYDDSDSCALVACDITEESATE
jgi:hypothetical protein